MVKMPIFIRLHLSRCDRRYSMRFNFVANLDSKRFSLSHFVCWLFAEFGSFIVVVVVVDVVVEHFFELIGDVDCNSNGRVALSSLASSFSLSLCAMLVRLIFPDHFCDFHSIFSVPILRFLLFVFLDVFTFLIFLFDSLQVFQLRRIDWLCSFLEPEDYDHVTHYYSVITLKWKREEKKYWINTCFYKKKKNPYGWFYLLFATVFVGVFAILWRMIIDSLMLINYGIHILKYT